METNLLRRVGMACFVTCLDDFKREHAGRCDRDDTKRAMHERGGAKTASSAATKATAGVGIIRRGLTLSALRVVSDSQKTPAELRERARSLARSE